MKVLRITCTPNLLHTSKPKFAKSSTQLSITGRFAASVLPPMRLSRSSRGNLLQSSQGVASPTVNDHVWISQNLLASTFRSFAQGQRRHGSQVPGPLEASRRLAKRRNTAFTRVTASSPFDDVSSLFGKDGKKHQNFVWRGSSMPGTNNPIDSISVDESSHALCHLSVPAHVPWVTLILFF